MYWQDILARVSAVHSRLQSSLALCWSDGRSQFVVDFSIHGERGKVDGKEQGLTARQRERRYNRKRDRDCQTEKRKEEYFVSKLERLKSMVKRPLEDCSPIYEGVHVHRRGKDLVNHY
ncbi:hypothetical protein NXV57_17890 [Bacteroides thetaiotaomicron]|nr:hypothetical protein [Bacteroides thetaiotaomicron]